ncbi:hypothetical protein BBO99_00007880 [Phytophthora kernoviae]|uniref:CSC1/OSCA1-like 7TM region domain-containing protein n=2 Tax=Phytophthora kernoviae TaxID=325452 RepID=A0A3R7NBZ1_9STRA|nr:hypothetical protein G195_009347 [Phytophthora kernoviae 00238/432]KAG2523501.1 hypothetical protein JM16_002281 [Phytophthora kernoviae]KAG2525426.1 hypothetical protein JM18_002331 [Phytophthora kernoviae]RLN37973.1 hypothetical protein BBI17_007836 [Phytophthora kernoviae]RLN76030.1 hypothetical protein BBO99_00007880 [Phytophthora kernoviae]
MCCVGLLLFQVLVYIVFALAQWDIALSNYIAPAHQCASPRLSPHRGLIGRNSYSGYRIAPGLTYFSPLSLMAMLYFVLVKPVIGSLSLLAVLLVIAPVVSFIASLTSQYHDDYNWIEIYGVSTMTMSRYPGFSLVGAILVALVAIALMQLVSKISLQATRFFCCENFTVTSRFHGGYPQVPSNHSHPSDRHHHLGVHWQYNNKPGFVITTLKLTLFHLLNALLGIVAFTAVITSVHIAFALIPLCCVGLLVFRGVVVLVQWLAKLDVKLANYVASPDEERVSLGVHDDEVGGFVDLRLSPELSYFSPVSVLGALYFATVKLVISVLSLVVVSVFALLPAMLFAFNDDDEHMHMWFKVGHHKYKDLCKDPFAFYIVWGCLFILCIVCMHVIAWISRFTTLFFCSERITASEYTIPVVEYPATATTATVYGSNIPTRL